MPDLGEELNNLDILDKKFIILSENDQEFIKVLINFSYQILLVFKYGCIYF